MPRLRPSDRRPASRQRTPPLPRARWARKRRAPGGHRSPCRTGARGGPVPPSGAARTESRRDLHPDILEVPDGNPVPPPPERDHREAQVPVVGSSMACTTVRGEMISAVRERIQRPRARRNRYWASARAPRREIARLIRSRITQLPRNAGPRVGRVPGCAGRPVVQRASGISRHQEKLARKRTGSLRTGIHSTPSALLAREPGRAGGHRVPIVCRGSSDENEALLVGFTEASRHLGMKEGRDQSGLQPA